jgi:hypothetical protein
MLVRASYRYNLFTFEAEVSGVDVRTEEVDERSKVGNGIYVRPSRVDDPFTHSVPSPVGPTIQRTIKQ